MTTYRGYFKAELFALLLGLLLGLPEAWAQETEGDKTPGRVQVRLDSVEMPTIASAGTIVLTVRNAELSTIAVEELRILSTLDQSNRHVACEPAQFDLDEKRTRSVECHFPGAAILETPALLFHREEPLRFHVKAKYSVAGSSAGDFVLQDFETNARAPLGGVVLGGFVGVLALPLFRRLWRRYSTGQWLGVRVDPPFFLACIVGWLTIALFLTVARYSASSLPDLPIQIQVRDFYGGVLCGLLFEPIARWLATITGQDGEAGGSKSKNSTDAAATPPSKGSPA